MHLLSLLPSFSLRTLHNVLQERIYPVLLPWSPCYGMPTLCAAQPFIIISPYVKWEKPINTDTCIRTETCTTEGWGLHLRVLDSTSIIRIASSSMDHINEKIGEGTWTNPPHSTVEGDTCIGRIRKPRP